MTDAAPPVPPLGVPTRLFILAGGLVLVRMDFVVLLFAAPLLAVWVSVRAFKDGDARVRPTADNHPVRWLLVDVATAAAWLVGAGDRLANDFRESGPPSPAIVDQLLGPTVLSLVFLGGLWVIGTLASGNSAGTTDNNMDASAESSELPGGGSSRQFP